jgi:hypothetical protein
MDSTTQKWLGPEPITVNGSPIEGITGTPAFIQSAFGKQGNFEMLVPEGERLVHYWRDNDAPGFPWHQGSDVVAAPSLTAPIKYAVKGATLLQGNFGGNLEAVVWLHPESWTVQPLNGPSPGDSLVHYYLERNPAITGGLLQPAPALRWLGPESITPNSQPITGISGPQ